MLHVTEKDLLYGSVLEIILASCPLFLTCPYVQGVMFPELFDVTGLKSRCNAIVYDPSEEEVYKGPCRLQIISEIQYKFPAYFKWCKEEIKAIPSIQKESFLISLFVGTGIIFSARGEMIPSVNNEDVKKLPNPNFDEFDYRFLKNISYTMRRFSPRTNGLSTSGWNRLLILLESFQKATEPFYGDDIKENAIAMSALQDYLALKRK